MSRSYWLPSRRGFLHATLGLSASGWMAALAADAARHPARKRSCILLWMAGGPSQTDTFDPKPGHANGGPFRSIATAVPGIQVGEHLPGVAAQMKDLAIVRSMKTREGDHGRATNHLRTGYLPQGPIEFPVLGALVARERDEPGADLPGYVSVAPPGLLGGQAVSAGFLGPRHAPLLVGRRPGEAGYQADTLGTDLRVPDLAPASGISADRVQRRRDLAAIMEADFLTLRPGVATQSHKNAYEQAVRLMRPAAAQAFDLSDEPGTLRDAYGRNRFGQGCLLARRLVERGVPFVEVVLGGWDTHADNFGQVKSLCTTLDPAWATLLTDLRTRGLLDSTLVVWMGEFGRTPAINPRQGRDHYPAAWSTVLGGGGIRGGQVIGRTGADGTTVEDRPVAVPDLLATIALALGLDPAKQNLSNVNRPIRLADPAAKPVREVLA